jgi:hypothetical protein
MRHLQHFKLCLFVFLLALVGCRQSSDDLEPTINYAVQDKYLKRLPSPFPPLTPVELSQDWGKEAKIGFGFAHQLDLYQAMTAFKRADLLIPSDQQERKMELQYEILLCYYLGKKYSDAVYTYETGSLQSVDTSFPACRELLIILYDSYTQLGDEAKAAHILKSLRTLYPDTEERIVLSSALQKGDLPEIRSMAPSTPVLQPLLTSYDEGKKSVRTARWLNTVLPGAGYFYVGQKQSAFTALLLNGLFIAAAYHFFDQGQVAAGAIFTSFEAGWYFGGIYGAGEEAKHYNERLYEKLATPLMNEQKLFPVLMLQYAF